MLRFITTTRKALSNCATKMLCEEVDGDLASSGDVPIESITCARLALDLKEAISGARPGDLLVIALCDGTLEAATEVTSDEDKQAMLGLVADALDLPAVGAVTIVPPTAEIVKVLATMPHDEPFTVAAFAEKMDIDDDSAFLALKDIHDTNTLIPVGSRRYRLATIGPAGSGFFGMVPVADLVMTEEPLVWPPLPEFYEAKVVVNKPGTRETFAVPTGWDPELDADGKATGRIIRPTYALLGAMTEADLLTLLSRAHERWGYNTFGAAGLAHLVTSADVTADTLCRMAQVTLKRLCRAPTPIALPGNATDDRPGWYLVLEVDGGFRFNPAKNMLKPPLTGRLP